MTDFSTRKELTMSRALATVVGLELEIIPPFIDSGCARDDELLALHTQIEMMR